MLYSVSDPGSVSGSGFLLDRSGNVLAVFPRDLFFGDPDPGSILRSMLTDSDAARLSEFCAGAPLPAGEFGAGASNTALVALRSDRFSFGAAIRTRMFSGNVVAFCLIGKTENDPTVPPLLTWRLPDHLIPIAEGLSKDAPLGGEYPLRALSADLGVRVGFDGASKLSSFIASVLRKLSYLPETRCGDVTLMEPTEDPDGDAVCVSFPAGAFADLIALLVSSLNSFRGCRASTVSVTARGASAEIFVISDDSGADGGGLSPSCDLMAVAARSPICFDRLSLAYIVSCAAGIPVSALCDGDGAVRGFSLTVSQATEEADFKAPYYSSDAGEVLDELDVFLRDLTFRREEAERAER